MPPAPSALSNSTPQRTTWQAKYFEDEVRPDMKHTKPGLLCMASAGENMNTSQFYITMRGEDLEVGVVCGFFDTSAVIL